MNKPLALTQRQIRAICEGARKAGHVPVLEINNVLIRLIPTERAIPPQAKAAVDEKEEDFEL